MATTPTTSHQTTTGSGNAVAGPGATASISTHYHAAEVAPAAAADVDAGRRLLATMPVDAVPEPGGLPPFSRRPFPHNRLFVGRDGEFRHLAQALRDGGAAAVGQIQALSGWGGVGKTQLASEFAWRYGRFFSGGVFWINCAEPADVPREIAQCGISLSLHSDFAGLPQETQVALVSGRWQDGLPRLLIFDNCEDPALFEAWCPPSGDCRVLVTCRRDTWPANLGVTTLPLGVLPRPEAVTLLRRHRPDLHADNPTLDAICEELGDLPLALRLAGSYLASYRHDTFGQPDAYLDAIREPGLLDHHSLKLDGRTPTGREASVAATFTLSFERLDVADPGDKLARSLLTHAAWFAPTEPIPRWLLSRCLDIGNDEAAQRTFTDALHRLAELGLVRTTDGDPALHRLVQAFARSVGSNDDRNTVEKVIGNAASEQNQTGLPGPLLQWQTHLRKIAKEADKRGSDRASWILNELGRHLQMIADFDGAKAAFQRVIEIDEAVYGSDHPWVATYVNNLGTVLHAKGDLDGAKAAFQRAFDIDETAYGPDNPNVARDVNNLGRVLQDEGDLDGAKAAYQRALIIDEAAYGPDHPSVAIRVNNLGLVLQDQGDLDGAKAAYQRALTIDEAAYGPDHPKVAIRVNNLGRVLHEQGDLDGAKAALLRALAITESAYGPDHPEVAIRVNNLGGVLQDQGDLDGAKAAFQRALTIDEAAYGPDNPKAAIRVKNLGGVLRKQGDFNGAKAAFQRALVIFEKQLGPNHPLTREGRINLKSLKST
jgi:tetratricopeptide (TPR) repeat protein